jgi:diguanylate cyclase (GGDEF)-like protein/PAS domain S-box-containing protein
LRRMDSGSHLAAVENGVPEPPMPDVDDVLRSLEPTLQLMEDAVIVLTSDLDPPGPHVVFVNSAFHRWTGYQPDEIVGKSLHILDGLRTDRSLFARIRHDLDAGRRFSGEAMVYRKAGSQLQVDWQIVPLFGSHGSVCYWLSTLVDSRKRRDAERGQKAAEGLYRQLVENQPDLISRFLPDTTLTFANAAYARFFQRRPEDLVGKRFTEFLSEEDAAKVMAKLTSVTPDDPARRYEHQMVRSDGTVRWYLWNDLARFDEDGDLLSFQSVGTDITDRKRAEEELRKLSGAVEHSPSSIIIAGVDGAIEYVNPAFTQITGYSLEEAIGKSPSILKSGRTSKAIYSDLWKTIGGGGVWRGELCNRRKNGDLYWALVAIAPVKDAAGTITHHVSIQHEITEQKLLQERMAHDATHDALTDLVNRREFERRLEHAFVGAKEHGYEHTLCYLDLDQFKLVNDTAGHAAGDELLKQIRGLLRGKFRGRDTLARLGGDEFGLLLDNCSVKRAVKIAEMVVATLRDFRFSWKGRTFHIGVSIGVAPVTADAESSAQILAQADVACYAAKERGRNRVRVYRKDGAEPPRQHREILRAATLRDALEEERFRLFCQPIVPLSKDGETPIRYELLLRLVDMGGEIVLPEAFIPAAERFGLMAAIDRWVIREGFSQYTEIFGRLPKAQIAINLSGSSLDDDTLLDYVRAQFDAFSLAPNRVCFEITETIAVHHLSRAAEFVAEITKMGGCVALDDFGSGLSSFSYLKFLPATCLKIDGSFVRDMMENTIDQAMVSAINEVGHVMGMTTIAEYAHSRAIVERLREMGVNYAQGYALGIPKPLEELHN